MTTFNASYWNARYQNEEIGWDLGKASNPLKEYINQLNDLNTKILVSGGGHSYEAEYLWNQGFKHVFVIDVAAKALHNFKQRVPDFPDEHLILGNFFDLNDTFDLILEQTFFCALDPKLRTTYVKKCHGLLNMNGKIAGVLFNFPLTEHSPPFGGDKEAYDTLFKPYFKINTLQPCYNSETSRKNKELFFIFEKTSKHDSN